MVAYVGSTLVVLLWLLYTVHVNLAENEQDAAGSPDPGRTSQLIRVSAPVPIEHLQLMLLCLPACVCMLLVGVSSASTES